MKQRTNPAHADSAPENGDGTFYWPASGRTQVFQDIPLDSYVGLVEGAERSEVRALVPVRLGGARR
jgi:hypothetical protein